MAGRRGDGSIYQRHRRTCDRRRRCSCPWWAKYSVAGRVVREPTRCVSEAEARDWLRARVVRAGQYGYKAHVLQVRDLEAVLATDWMVTGRRATRRLAFAFKHLNKRLGQKRVADVRYGDLAAYVAGRFEEGAAPATVRVELALLKRSMNLVEGLVLPRFPAIAVDNARKRFFTRAEFERLRAELPSYLRGPATVMYLIGWRKSEVLRLEWRDVDWEAGVLHLRPELSKGGHARQVPFALVPALEDVLQEALWETQRAQRRLGRLVSWVFHRGGQQIKNMSKAWSVVRAKAGLAHTPHDFRRTAVRNLELVLQVPRATAMQIVGHRTEDMYRRYAISTSDDVAEAMRRVGEHFEEEQGRGAKVIQFPRQRR